MGHWTMIYDEAFEVNVNELSFLAFFRFERLTSNMAPSKMNIEGFQMLFLHVNGLQRLDLGSLLPLFGRIWGLRG